MTAIAINFTKTTLSNLLIPANQKRSYYKDTQLKGLSLAIQSSGAKSFYVIKKISGKSAKIFLGKYPDLSIENARKQASIILGQIALGINPQLKKQQIRAEMTFAELFEQYMTSYSKVHKKTWKADEQDIPRFCKKWFTKRISQIAKDDIQRLHETVYRESGLYAANAILKRIRAVYNKAEQWGWQGHNPTKGIKKYREQSRDRFIQPAEMPHIIRAINELAATIRDYFWLLLLTGARKTNTMMMRWDEINWQQCEWRIPTTKNGDPVIIPLTDPAIEILQKRRLLTNSPFVFPSIKDNEKHITNVKREWKQVKTQATVYLREQDKQSEATLMDIRIHDLRRTFGSYQAISGASLHIIGKSLGHRSTQATQIYARLNMDAVRESVNKATSVMLALQ